MPSFMFSVSVHFDARRNPICKQNCNFIAYCFCLRKHRILHPQAKNRLSMALLCIIGYFVWLYHLNVVRNTYKFLTFISRRFWNESLSLYIPKKEFIIVSNSVDVYIYSVITKCSNIQTLIRCNKILLHYVNRS